MQLILASSSPIRRKLLSQLGLPFTVVSPDVDESLTTEDREIAAYAARLSRKKAHRVAQDHPHALIIAADQACTNGTNILGKPGDAKRAFRQLQDSRGKWLHFHTALTLYRPAIGWMETETDTYSVRFADLSDEQILAYLDADQPWDCAGSFRLESRAMALFSDLSGRDYTCLLGLPLLLLCRLMRQAGVEPLGDTAKSPPSRGSGNSRAP